MQRRSRSASASGRRPLAVAALVVALATSAGLGAWLASSRPEGGERAEAPRAAALDRLDPAGVSEPAAPRPVAAAAGGDAAPSLDADGGGTPLASDGESARDGGAQTGAERDAAQLRPPAGRGPVHAPRPSVEPGFVNIVSIPVAEVFLGPRHLGATPLRRVPLTPGRHALQLRAPERGLTERVVVRVRPGEVSYVSVRLEP